MPRYRLHLSLFVVVVLSVGAVTTAAAQDATADATPGGPSEGYPVAVHEGTCNNPVAEPMWQIDDAVSIGVEQDEPDVIGIEVSRIVTAASGSIDASLDDLGSTEHLVAIHASPAEFGTLVACGQVAGVKEDGRLVIALATVGDSAVFGIAILEEDDDQTQLTVYVVPPSNEDAATPAS